MFLLRCTVYRIVRCMNPVSENTHAIGPEPRAVRGSLMPKGVEQNI